MARAEQFLEQGKKVRVRLQFRGRENAHREIGFDVLNQCAENLKDMAHVDQPPRLAGRAVNMMLSPLSKETQTRHFLLRHGNLVDPDDEGDEDVEFDDDDGDESPVNEASETPEEKQD